MTTAKALSILQWTEEGKCGKEVTKEERRQKTTSKNTKKLTKASKEIPAPSNIPQRKSSQSCKKLWVVLENDDLSTEEEFIEESTEEFLYVIIFRQFKQK